jgi:hypothetical protein
MLDIGATIASALAGGQSIDATFSTVDTSWLIPSRDLAIPRGIIARRTLASQIEQALHKYGRVILARVRQHGAAAQDGAITRRPA